MTEAIPRISQMTLTKKSAANEAFNEEAAASLAYSVTKPVLTPSFCAADVTPAPIVCARLMDSLQDYILSTAEPAELKQEYVGSKMSKTKQALRQNEKSILESKKAIEGWEWKKKIAYYIFNGASLLAGVGLCASGQIGAGGSLIASSVGTMSASALSSYGCNSTLTGALSVASSVVGVFGFLGFGAYNLIKQPQAIAAAIQQGSFSSFVGAASAITSFTANGFTHLSTIKKNENLNHLSQLEALHTKSDTFLRTLDQKHSAAASAFQSNAKNFSDGFKTISKAYTRYTRDVMRVLTAEFPG